MVRRRAVLLGAVAIAWGGRAALASDELGLLFTRFRASPGFLAQFVEDRHIELLTAPLRSHGSIHFSPEFGLARHCRKPTASSLLVTAVSVQLWDGRKVEVLPVAKDSSLRAFIDLFGMLLAGNRPGVESRFATVFEGKAAEDWLLTLTPTDTSIGRLVTKIALRGAGAVVRDMRVEEAGGDFSVTTFSDTDVAHKYSKDEVARYFRLPPPRNL